VKLCRTLFLIALLLPATGRADEVPLDALGDLDLAYATLDVSERIPGPPLRAVVRAGPGEAFRVMLPAAVQRASFRVSPGQPVSAGDPVVLLEGAEIHHWLLEYEALEQRFATARRRYESNLPLYRDKALPAERWADIEERFLTLSLEREHMQHFLEWVLPGSAADGDALLLGAPMDGIVVFDSRAPSLDAGSTVFEVLPDASLRLQVEVPAGQPGELAALAADDCEVAVERLDAALRDFYAAAWSEPLSGPCRYAPGTVLSVRPFYARQAVIVPRGAVFQLRREPHLWLRQGDRLRAHPLTLLADTAQGYAVTPDQALAGAEVLVRSVSAVQGILLGLGGE
jgi:hypothetical protein